MVAGAARDDFAFVATPASRSTPASGSAVHLWRSGPSTVTVARSSTLSAFTVSCTGGKNKVCSPSLSATGAASFTVYLASGAVTSGPAPSTISVAATVPDRYSVSITGAVTYSLGSAASKATLTGGVIRTW